MATVYDKIWLPVKMSMRNPEQEALLKAEALNTMPEYDTSQKRQVGLFHIAGLVSEEGFKTTIQQGLIYLGRVIEEGEAEIHHRPVWSIIEDFYVFSSEMKSLMLFMEEYFPNDSYKCHATDCIEQLEQLYQRVRFSEILYRALKIDDSAQIMVEKFITNKLIEQYEKLGFSLDQQFDFSIHETIIELIENFKDNLSTEQEVDLMQTRSSRDFLKQSYSDVTLVNIRSHSYAHFHHIREAGFKSFFAYDEAQEDILEAILKARNEFAKSLNYNSYGSMMIEGTAFGKVQEVNLFLRYLQDSIREIAEKEYAIMASLKSNFEESHPFVVSDVKFITEWARDQLSQEELDDIPSYLTLGQCIDGVNQILRNIFFIHFDINNVLFDEVYGPDMYKLQVIHVTHGIVSYVFLDLMKRPGKPTKVTHYILREGKFEPDNDYISKLKWRPIRILLIMSIEKSEHPAEFTIREAESLFMELGRIIPPVLYHVHHQYMNRKLACFDVSHIVAHLMKEIFYDPRVMAVIFKTYPCGKGLTPNQINNIVCSRKIFRASQYQMLILRSAVDNNLYSDYPLPQKLKHLLKKLDKMYYSVPMFEECFLHLKDVGLIDQKTSGKIFNELVDLIVIKRLWHRFLAKDPMNSEKSDDLLQLVKECMTISDPVESYSKLLDMEIDVTKMGKILVDDAKECFEQTERALEQLIYDSKVYEEPEIEDDKHAADVYAYFSQ